MNKKSVYLILNYRIVELYSYRIFLNKIEKPSKRLKIILTKKFDTTWRNFTFVG